MRYKKYEVRTRLLNPRKRATDAPAAPAPGGAADQPASARALPQAPTVKKRA